MAQDTEQLLLDAGYGTLSDKGKEALSQIEKLLNGLSYNEVEAIAFALMQSAKTSLVVP